MSNFEIGTCFTGKRSELDASLCQEALAPYLKSDIFVLEEHTVFFGRRLAHTNARVKLRDVTLAEAKEARKALETLTGVRWNAPTQDPDEVEEEAGGRSWGMFTSEGASRVAGAVALLEESLRNGTLSPAEEFLTNAVEAHMNAIAGEGHAEVFDTAVREEVYGRLDKVIKELGVWS